MRRVALPLAAVVLLAGCGSNVNSTRITSDTLSIYTGLPLRGERADIGRAVLRGEKLALDEAGGRAGDLNIGLVALDDTKTSTRTWDPGQVAANARQAAENPTTIAYIGDVDSGATAVSLPITNETGVLHISPLSGYTGLTLGADKGEPAKYYPSAKHNFARLVPTGSEEATVLAKWIKTMGFNRVALAYDGLQEGLGQGGELERALHAASIDVVDIVRVDPRDSPSDVVGDAQDLARGPAAALVYAGGSVPAALALLKAVHAREPGEAFFVTSGIAVAQFAAAGLAGAERQVYATSPLIPINRRPAQAQRVAAMYKERFGAKPPPAALYGYEAMRGVLDAIAMAGRDGNDRAKVIAAYFHRTVTASVLGPYTIDPVGDVSETAFGGFRIKDGRLRFDRLFASAAG